MDLENKGIKVNQEELISAIARNRRIRQETVGLYAEVLKVMKPEIDKLFENHNEEKEK
jgi:hypothetical protein